MSYNPNLLATDPIQRIRLMVGDIYSFPLLEDGTYDYLYLINEGNELDAAINAVEIIINMLVLNPKDEAVGGVNQKQVSVSDLQAVLQKLQDRKDLDAQKVRKIPTIIKANKQGWKKFDALYGGKDC